MFMTCICRGVETSQPYIRNLMDNGSDVLLSKGCGGVGILWKKSFDVTPIGEIDSDRICGVRLRLTHPEMKEVTILGVYASCADAGIDMYKYSVS